MRTMLLAVAATLTVLAAPAQAREYPWCSVEWGPEMGARNCGFETLAQCRATISGIGGDCQMNTMYAPMQQRPPRRKARH